MGDDLDEVASLNATLEAFVVRARRVKSHSLVRDAIGLKELAAVRVQLVVDDGASGRARRVAELPDEEAIESLAARVRPVVLQGDPVYWADAVKALRRLAHLRGDHMVQAELRRLKAAWKEADPNQGAGRFFQVQVRNLDGGGLAAGRDDAQLALGWFYGDVVHADTARREDLSRWGITSRFEAAVPHVAQIAWMTVQTLDLIQDLQQRGWLALGEDAFVERVVADRVLDEEVTIFTAPIGTPNPDPDGDFPRGWKIGLPMLLNGEDYGYSEDRPEPRA